MTYRVNSITNEANKSISTVATQIYVHRSLLSHHKFYIFSFFDVLRASTSNDDVQRCQEDENKNKILWALGSWCVPFNGTRISLQNDRRIKHEKSLGDCRLLNWCRGSNMLEEKKTRNRAKYFLFVSLERFQRYSHRPICSHNTAFHPWIGLSFFALFFCHYFSLFLRLSPKSFTSVCKCSTVSSLTVSRHFFRFENKK